MAAAATANNKRSGGCVAHTRGCVFYAVDESCFGMFGGRTGGYVRQPINQSPFILPKVVYYIKVHGFDCRLTP